MKKLFTLITAVCMLIIATMTGCTVSTAQTGSIQYDENIIQEAIQRQVDLIPIYTDPALLPINYEVHHLSGNVYNVTIGNEVIQLETTGEAPTADGIDWKKNLTFIRGIKNVANIIKYIEQHLNVFFQELSINIRRFLFVFFCLQFT